MKWLVACWRTIPRQVSGGGRWIPYSAQQVALRRAARLTCVMIGLGGGVVVGGPGTEAIGPE